MRTTKATTLTRTLWGRLRSWEVLLVVGSSIALVLLTADVVAGGLATYVDEQVLAALDGRESESLTTFSGVGELGLSGAVLLIVTLVSTQATWRLWPVAVSVGTVGVGLLLVLGLKAAVARPGPGEAVLPEGYPGFFPSGHTATAGLCLGTACFVMMAWRGYGAGRVSPATAAVVTGLMVASLVGLGTAVGGNHWATDAVGGVLVTAIVLPLGCAAGSYYALPAEGSGRDSQRA